jgi:trigger factor
VEIPWSEVSARIHGKMRDLQQRVRVPGFRPGKVPPKMVEQMYGKSVRDEVARDLVDSSFEQEVSGHQARPLTKPVVESTQLADGESFSYSARFEVAPVIEPKDYEGVPVKRRAAVVSEEQVEASIEEMRQAQARIEPLPEDSTRTETQAGDVWTLDVDGHWGEEAIGRKNLTIEVGGKAPVQYLPGLAEEVAKFALADVGSVKKLSYLPNQDNLLERFKGKSIDVTLGLREVKVRVVPALDDDFARDTGEAETLEELRTKVRERLLEEDKLQAERDARLRMMGELLNRNPVTPAPSMVTNECAAQIQLLGQQLSQQGLSFKALGRTPEQMMQSIRPRAKTNVSAFLLLDAIARKESIEVPEAEVEAEVAAMAEEQSVNPQRLRAQMEKDNRLLLLRAQLREDKIFKWLMDRAAVTEVSAEELAASNEALPDLGPILE